VDLCSASKALRYGTRSQGISQFNLYTPRTSANGMNRPGQPKLVLMYRPRRDGRLSWPWVAGWLHTEISVPARRRLTSLIEARRLDEAEKKRAERKARAGSISTLGSEHTCPTCGKDFRAQIGLFSHLRTHRPLGTSN